MGIGLQAIFVFFTHLYISLNLVLFLKHWKGDRSVYVTMEKCSIYYVRKGELQGKKE